MKFKVIGKVPKKHIEVIKNEFKRVQCSSSKDMRERMRNMIFYTQ